MSSRSFSCIASSTTGALLYSPAVLGDDLGGHDVLALEEAEVCLSEGPLHIGMSAVVRALVRRR